MKIAELPGVGPTLATRIEARFRNGAFEAALEAKDIESLMTVDGVSERRAAEWIRLHHGIADSHVACTPSAQRIQQEILDRLRAYACTERGRSRLRLIAPAANPEEAAARTQRVIAAKQAVAGIDAQAVARAMRRLSPLRFESRGADPTHLVVAEDDEVFDRLHAMGVAKWASLGTPRDLAEAAAYDMVIVATDDGDIDTGSLDNALEVSIREGLAGLCPHAILEPLKQQRGVIEALAAWAAERDTPTAATEALTLLDAAAPARVDPAAVRAAVARIKTRLDGELEARVADLRLEAGELLRALSSGKLPGPLKVAADAVLTDGRRALREETGLAFQPFRAGLPVGVDDDEVDRVIDGAKAQEALALLESRRAAAKRLDALVPALQAEIDEALAFDETFALGRFALDHDLHAPTWSDRLAFEASIHLDLCQDPRAQRIAYRLGGDDNVVVLTGANSGGKSTLLEHLCQIVIMARLGLGVVGQGVEVPWVDELHLVTARKGLDAGAFETFLRGFLPLGDGDARRLVLADEVEAVTESEAAGRILAYVLDRLALTDSLAIVVTHLAPQVLAHVQAARVRVDGIEATGLDEEHRLIVDRTPKMGRAARSTPELIIRRLAATTRGREQGLYEDLLARFQDPVTAPAVRPPMDKY